jgi:hypothetical protein
MKKISTTILAIFILFAITSCSHRLGNLTMISTRNIETSKDYKELKRTVVGKDKSLQKLLLLFGPFGSPDMELALNKVVNTVPGGEFMKNVIVTERYNWYLLFSIRVLIIEGDVWGIPQNERQNTYNLKIGDKVTWKETVLFKDKWYDGEVMAVSAETATVKYIVDGVEKRKEIKNEVLKKKE